MGATGGRSSNGMLRKLMVLAAALAVVFWAGPKALDAIDGDQCRDVASMSYGDQLAATRKVLDNSMMDRSGENPELWRSELVSYCAANPDDDLDDIAPYGW